MDLAAPRIRGSPTYALIDIDPGAATTWEDVLVLARLHRTALAHLGVRAQPKVTGRRGIQIWIPVIAGTDLSGHPRLGGGAVQGDRRRRARAGQLEVGRQRAARPGAARLHAEREQQDPGRSV